MENDKWSWRIEPPPDNLTHSPCLKKVTLPRVPTNPSRSEVPMKSKFSVLSILLLVLFSVKISFANESAAVLARKAISETATELSLAIEELRSMGPAGLQILMDQYSEEIKRHVT